MEGMPAGRTEERTDDMEDRKARLDISTFTGASQLFLHFNYTPKERDEIGDPYYVLRLALKKYLIRPFREEGRNRFDDAKFYKVTENDGPEGFCLSVEWADPGEEESLELVSGAIGYAESFDPEDLKYPDEESREWVMEHLEGMKALAAELRRQIFEDRSYTYKTERVSFFD